MDDDMIHVIIVLVTFLLGVNIGLNVSCNELQETLDTKENESIEWHNNYLCLEDRENDIVYKDCYCVKRCEGCVKECYIPRSERRPPNPEVIR